MENIILLLLRKRKYGTIRDRSEGRNLIVEIFSERLVKARKKRQLTQKAAAALIGIQASSLSAYEGGRKTPSVEIAMQIAKAYEVSLDWLVGNANAVENTTDNEVLFKIETKGEFIRVLSSLCMSPIQCQAQTRYGDNGFSSYAKITFFTDTDWLPNYVDKFNQIAEAVKKAGLDEEVLDAWVGKQVVELKDESLTENYRIVSDDELPF